MIEGRLDEKLALAITSMRATINEDKTAIVLEPNDKKVSIPLTVENIDELSQKSCILVGKMVDL